jgi:hypothetical protein
MTNASGAYAFELVPAGPISLRALDPAALEQADTRTTVVASDTVVANLVLFGGVGLVRGAVFEEDGTPAANLPIYGGPAVVHTDAAGQFVLENVPVGMRDISAFDAARQRLVTRSVSIRNAGDEAVVQLIMPARGIIAGRILQADNRTPAANVRVIIFGPGVHKVFTDSDGRYRAENLPMGEYTVSAFFSDNSDGNVATGKLVFNNQVQQINLTFRGRGAAAHRHRPRRRRRHACGCARRPERGCDQIWPADPAGKPALPGRYRPGRRADAATAALRDGAGGL